MEALEKGKEELQQAHDQLETKVRERTQELQHLNEELITIQETERRRIAQDLHDNITATLTALKFKIEGKVSRLSQDCPHTEISFRDVIQTLLDLIKETRRMMANLSPSMLEELGLLPTINWFCREFQASYSNVEFHCQVGISENEIPDKLKIVIYRVIQEASNNAAKHSQANQIRLSLFKEDGRMDLIIQDNGHGLDLGRASAERKGLGLLHMRERVVFSGGTFCLESALGSGTVIKATWPIG
jgi:signal transduction histidine kinase